MNDAGVIAGTTEDHKLALWSKKDGLHQIELPSDLASVEPLAINRKGDVVGAATREGSSLPIAFEYSHGKLWILGEGSGRATAMRDSDVAGELGGHLVLWREQKSLGLGDCCGGSVRGMNRHGEIVGQANNKDGRYDAFLSAGVHGLTLIAPPGSMSSTAIAINDSGHTVVQVLAPNAVFLRKQGKLLPVHLSPDVASQPLAINDCDVIVGEFGAASDFYHAFVWDEKLGFRDLNGLVDSASGWILASAVDINDRGEIIGTGAYGGDDDAGFLLVPSQQSLTTKDTKVHEGISK